MSNLELTATGETVLLRGGHAGENVFTDAAALDAKRERQRLGVDGPLRDQRIDCGVTNDAAVSGLTYAVFSDDQEQRGSASLNGLGLAQAPPSRTQETGPLPR